MKQHFVIWTLVITTALVLCLHNPILHAADEDNGDIAIQNTSFEVLKIDESKTMPVVYYKIIIVVQNAGDSLSENITVVLTDDDTTEDYEGTKTRMPDPAGDQIRLQPGESKAFTFGEHEDWMILGKENHEITVTIHPNNNESRIYDTQILTLSPTTEETNQTPAFDSLLFFCSALCIFVVWVKKRKK